MTAPSNIPTPATPDVCTLSVLLDGEALPGDAHVRAITVNRELNRIPWASIHLDDGEAPKATFATSEAPLFKPGKQIEIQLGYRAENETVFKGRIVRQRIKVRKNGSGLEVHCCADAVKATGTCHNRYFTDVKDSEVMEQALSAYGLTLDVEATDPQLKEVVQYDCTDWDFTLCRAEANGQVVLVADDKITISKPKFTGEPAVKLAFGATLLEFDAEIDARGQSKGIKAVSWKSADQQAIEAEAQEPTLPEAGNVSATDLAAVMGDETSEIRHGGALDEQQLQAWADARLLRMRLGRLRGRARCQGLSTLAPGMLAEITGIGERFHGKLYVCGVRHTVSAGNWETDFQFGLPKELFAETFPVISPPASGLLPAASGLQIGIVTALESDPDGEDRIKCRLPMISADDEGTWARLATLDAGDGRGTFYRPEIGDEVIVGFLNDDPRHPVILGMCHSSAKPAPEPASDDNHRKGYVSREKLKLIFDDENKVIVVETPGGNMLTLSDKDKGISIKDQNGNSIVMDDKGITITCKKDLKISVSKDMKLESMNAELAAKRGFKASGNSTAELSGAQVKVSGDAMTVIKGGMVKIN